MTQTMPAAEYRRRMGLTASKATPPARPAKGRLPAPGRSYSTEAMNQTEARYAGNLDALKHTGKVIDWKYESIKLRLADKTFYTADFFVLMADGSIEVHEVKGHWEDDARVKIKVAAKEYPWFKFVAVKAKKRDWEYEYFGWAGRAA